jgi:hypothetical protein
LGRHERRSRVGGGDVSATLLQNRSDDFEEPL